MQREWRCGGNRQRGSSSDPAWRRWGSGTAPVDVLLFQHPMLILKPGSAGGCALSLIRRCMLCTQESARWRAGAADASSTRQRPSCCSSVRSLVHVGALRQFNLDLLCLSKQQEGAWRASGLAHVDIVLCARRVRSTPAIDAGQADDWATIDMDA